MSSAASSSNSNGTKIAVEGSSESSGARTHKPTALEFKFRDLAGDFHSVPITIGICSPRSRPIQADAETLASYCDEEAKTKQLLADVIEHYNKLDKFRGLTCPEMEITFAVGEEQGSFKCEVWRAIRTVDELDDEHKADLAKKFGIPIGEVGEWGLELSYDGCYRLRSIGNTDSETTTGASSREKSEKSRSSSVSAPLAAAASNTPGGGNAVDNNNKNNNSDNANGSDNVNDDVIMSENVNKDGLLDVLHDDSLILPAGIELPAFAQIGEGGLLGGEENSSNSEDVSGEDVEDSEGPAQKKRKVMPENENESSGLVIPNNDLTSSHPAEPAASGEVVSAKNGDASSSISQGNTTANGATRNVPDANVVSSTDNTADNVKNPARSSLTNDPAVYFIDLYHIQKLVAKHLGVKWGDIIGVVLERESSEPVCLTPEPLLDRSAPLPEERHWIPFYVAHDSSATRDLTNDVTTAKSNSLNQTNNVTSAFPIELRVVVMEHRWGDRKSAPPASEFLDWGLGFFEQYCHCREYLYYNPHPSSSSPTDQLSCIMRFIHDIITGPRRNFYWSADKHLPIFGASLSLDDVLSMLQNDAAKEHLHRFFEHLDPAIRDNKDVALKAMQGADYSLSHLFSALSSRLREDKDVVMAAIEGGLEKHIPHVLQHTSSEICDDRDVISRAVQRWGFVLKYASQRLRDDEAIVEVAISKSRAAAEFPSLRLQTKSFCVSCMKFQCSQQSNETHVRRPLGAYLASDTHQRRFRSS